MQRVNHCQEAIRFMEYPGVEIETWDEIGRPWGYPSHVFHCFSVRDNEVIRHSFGGQFLYANLFVGQQTQNDSFSMTQDGLRFVSLNSLKECAEYAYNQRSDKGNISNMIYGQIGIHP